MHYHINEINIDSDYLFVFGSFMSLPFIPMFLCITTFVKNGNQECWFQWHGQKKLYRDSTMQFDIITLYLWIEANSP